MAQTNSSVQGCTPLSPWMHSIMTAQMRSPWVSNRRSKASTSLMGVAVNPPGSGWKASCLAGWAVAASVAKVRPWKLLARVTMRRGANSASLPAASVRRRAYRRASLIAHSLASAPEFAKKVFHVSGLGSST